MLSNMSAVRGAYPRAQGLSPGECCRAAVGEQLQAHSRVAPGLTEEVVGVEMTSCPLDFPKTRSGSAACTLLTAPLPSLAPRLFQHPLATCCTERTSWFLQMVGLSTFSPCCPSLSSLGQGAVFLHTPSGRWRKPC